MANIFQKIKKTPLFYTELLRKTQEGLQRGGKNLRTESEILGGTFKESAKIFGRGVDENVIEPFGRFPLRFTAALGAKIAAGDIKAQFDPQGNFQKELYGTNKPFGFSQSLEGLPGEEKIKSPAARGTAGFILSSLDFTPIGKTVKQTLPLLKVANKTDDALRVLRGIAGMATKVAERYAPLIAKTTDEAELLKLTNNALRESQDIIQIAKRLPGKVGDAARSFKAIGEKTFEGLQGLSTKLLEKFRGMPETIKLGKAEEIINLTKKQGLKPLEEEMFRKSMVIENGNVNLLKTAVKVEEQLVPLIPTPVKSPRWSNIGEDFISDGKYGEIVYQSPIKTSAGDIHFPARSLYLADNLKHGGENFPNYFSHVRYEDMADGKTRKILETQSDLMQKENFPRSVEGYDYAYLREMEASKKKGLSYSYSDYNNLKNAQKRGEIGMEEASKKLEPYSSNDPLAQLRTFREEVKRAAKDGKDTLLIPSGETAMKIEGLGEQNTFRIDRTGQIARSTNDLKVGEQITDARQSQEWIITDILGDGKFKAVPKNVDKAVNSWSTLEDTTTGGKKIWLAKNNQTGEVLQTVTKVEAEKVIKEQKAISLRNYTETFDISGKVDTKHFVYKLNEEAIPKEARKQGLVVEGKINQDNGEWWKIKIPKEKAKAPVEAFGVMAGIEQDEEGNIQFDSKKAAIGVIGLGVLKRAKNDDAFKSLNKVDEVLDVTDPKPENAGLFLKFRNAMGSFWEKGRKVAEDDWIQVKKMIQSGKYKVDKDFNPYDVRKRYYGRVGAKLEDAIEEVNVIDRDFIKTAKNLKIEDANLQDETYQYLIARHAPERNLRLGEKAAGITTEEANTTLTRLKALPHFKEIERLGENISNLNKKTLEVLLRGRVLSQKEYDILTKAYKYHIPLQRVFEESDNVFDVLIGRGLDVKGTGLKRAVGSERKVADILSNVTANYEQAVVRAEKNLVDLATLKFYRDNKEVLENVITEFRPRAIGKTFAKEGEEGSIILEKVNDPNVLAIMEDGKQVYLQFTDSHLAATFKGVNRAKQDVLMRTIGAITRFYSGLHTRFNPEFFLSNKIRDVQEAATYAASQGNFGFKGVGKMFGREALLEGERAVLNFMRGIDTEDARLYNEMRQMGGTTGGMALSTKKAVELSIEQLRKLNRSKSRQAARYVIDKIDNLNQIFEDSTRFVVYKQALKQGMSKEVAAVLAKDASIDFNKMGTGGPIINALYMFSNASIQGSTKMLRAFKNPKVLGSVVATIGASVYAINEWNDRVDSDWRNKVSQWDRLNNLNIVYPSDEGITYVNIPVSWGLKPIKVISDYTFDLAEGKAKDFGDAMSGIFASIIEAYNPAGGTDISSAITPTIADIPVAIARNVSWTGGKIKPDWDVNAPESIKYFGSLERKAEGQVAIETTKKLAEKGIEISPADAIYAYEQLIGGVGRFGSKVVNTINSLTEGEKVEVRETPFVSRFLRTKSEEEALAGGIEYSEIKDILSEQSKQRFYRSKEAERLDLEFSQMPRGEANIKMREIRKEDSLLFEAIRDAKRDREQGLTAVEKLIKQLGVTNGERARYIHEQVLKLKNNEQKNNYINDLRKKKLISDEVLKQLKKLKREDETSENTPEEKASRPLGERLRNLIKVNG